MIAGALDLAFTLFCTVKICSYSQLLDIIFSLRNPLHIPWCASGLNKVVFGDGLKHDVLTRQMGRTHSNNALEDIWIRYYDSYL